MFRAGIKSPNPRPRSAARAYCSRVDILIMILLLVIALMIWRGANRHVIIALWFVGLVAAVGLFRFHVTSHLDLSF